MARCACKSPCCKWKCCKCGKTWESYPEHATCTCGSLYVEWVNYEDTDVRPCAFID